MKRELSKSSVIKDLGPAKQIVGMEISHNKKFGKLWLSQKVYIERVLEKFNMSKVKSVYSPFAGHFKLSSEHYSTSEKEKQEMRGIPYASVVGSLMYDVEC